MKLLRAPVLQFIREHRKNPVISATAVLCEKFVRAYYNEDIYSFEKNGELRVLSLIASRFPQDNFVALDVGANQGDWTQAVLDQRPGARVLCFEILPDAAAALKVRFQDVFNVDVFNVGLSSAAGEVVFCWNRSCETASSITPRRHHALFEFSDTEDLICKVAPGDTFVNECGLLRIDFMKIDVEGHEVDVLKGFRDTLADDTLRPGAIQFEYGNTFLPSGRRLADVYELLVPHGYVIGRIFPRSVEFKDYSISDDHFRMGNYIAVQANSDLHALLKGR
jgi:FkbM family methyltransferase